jgi:type III restriction enzyme
VIELKEFQKQAADRIAGLFHRHYEDPPWRGTQKHRRVVPFFQALASITASGKTVILADAMQSICATLPLKPVVIWLSKGKVVVEQSFTNLSAGGKYHHLLGDVRVATLAEYDADEVRASAIPLVYFATVGTFNQKDKETGSRLIFRSDIDTAESSTWEALKGRADAQGHRRPLVIVYDEGHNLTDQQMELLLELEPDGLIAASATMRLPQRLAIEIKHLKDEGWTDDELITSVDASAVADSGLIKSTIILAGYEAPMEETIDSLIEDLRDAERAAEACGLEQPKAIYVAKTNIVEGDSLQRDNPRQPFSQRKAPPILIWRYLVEHHDVNPDKIAVYCSLRIDKDYPSPDGFRLFSGGEKDYDAFVRGGFQHVIFNLSLQEGWDDPLCYFCYIDKSMESSVQVEQVIGRLLRQPGGQRYPLERLNTAHFYVRVDRRGVFGELLGAVSRKLSAEAPGIRLVEAPPGKSRPEALLPSQSREVFETAYVTTRAVPAVHTALGGLADYRNDDGTNTKSRGGRTLVQRVVGEIGEPVFEWEEFEHTNMVSARWLFQREVARLFHGALGIAPTDQPKFDAMVGFGSIAHTHIERVARDVVDAYVDNVYLKQKRVDAYTVGPALVRRTEMTAFKNSLHAGYSDMNPLEIAFGKALDTSGVVWCRNAPRSGYGIPLISIGTTKTFFPDFLVWQNEDVLVIDTTGAHLLRDKAARKLLAIAPAAPGMGRLTIRFVSQGKWDSQLQQIDPDGYTVWSQKQDMTLRATAFPMIEEAVEWVLQVDPA